jgi:dephospho-CoA kinase
LNSSKNAASCGDARARTGHRLLTTGYQLFLGKPIIGILGGIGSGKSFVARLFGELGCLVVDSDAQVALAYQRDDVRRTIVSWWGEQTYHPDGRLNRRAIAERVFNDGSERARLERLLHPIVAQMRDEAMSAAPRATVAFVWDTPLLVEAGYAGRCDALVFVDVPDAVRLERVRTTRGWTEADWRRREKLQMSLDIKRPMAKYTVRNTAGADDVRLQVRQVLSRILAETSGR